MISWKLFRDMVSLKDPKSESDHAFSTLCAMNTDSVSLRPLAHQLLYPMSCRP